MKKFISGLIVLILALCLPPSIGCLAAPGAELIRVLEEGEIYLGGIVRNDVADVRFTGDGYIIKMNDGEDYFTVDFVNMKKVDVYDDSASFDRYSRMGGMDEITRAGDVYIARSDVYDNYGKSGRVLEDKGYLYVLNDEFGLIKKIEFDDYVSEISYVDGMYYVQTSDRSDINASAAKKIEAVYESADLNAWTRRDDLEHVPLYNGRTALTLIGEDIYMFKNGKPQSRVSYESMRALDRSGPYSDTASQRILNVFGDYFCVANNDEKDIYGDLWMSVDGVYFKEFELNTLEFIPETDALCDRHESAYVLKSDIDRYLTDEPIYVKLSGVFLGFDDPPVMTDGEVWAPAEFLIKSAGGSVSAADGGFAARVPRTYDQKMRTFDAREEREISLKPSGSVSFSERLGVSAVPIKMIGGKPYASVRDLARSLGMRYIPPAAERTAEITKW